MLNLVCLKEECVLIHKKINKCCPHANILHVTRKLPGAITYGVVGLFVMFVSQKISDNDDSIHI